MSEHSVYVFDNLYNKISHDCLAGMFFASLYENSSDPAAISLVLSDGTIQIAHRMLPKHKSISIEIPYVDCFPYQLSKIEVQLGSLASSAIGVCEYSVIGTRYDSDGNILSTLICGFDGFETVQGFIAYIQSSGIYPAEMIIFHRQKFISQESKTSILPIDMNINFINYKNHRRLNNWAAPSNINLEYEGQIHSFNSPLNKGWLLEDLKNAIFKKWAFNPHLGEQKITDKLIYYQLK